MNENCVLCAIDVNDFSQAVVDLAAAFARQFETELHLVHVTLFPDPATAAWPAYLGSPNQLIRDNRRLLTIQPTEGRIVAHHHHLSGIPADKILGLVESSRPQLIVVGTHGRRGLSRLFQGSVAAQIMRHADCPVMVLRQMESTASPVEIEESKK